jgi:hypothetical protein
MRLPVRRSLRVVLLAAVAGVSLAFTPMHTGRGPGRLAIARVQYEGGGDWYANPSSLPNLIREIAERTALPIERVEAKVTFTDSALFDFPFLHITGHGEMKLSEIEVKRLREYLTRGGFLHVDDNYGLDDSFRREIKRVFPDRPLVDVPHSHPIYHLVYDFENGPPKVHEHDGKPCTTPTPPTSATDGKTWAPIPIRRCSTNRPSAWA